MKAVSLTFLLASMSVRILQAQSLIYTTFEDYMEPYLELDKTEKLSQCDAVGGVLYDGYCVKWDGPAQMVDKTYISGLRFVDEASSCPYKCSLWGLCAPKTQARVCKDSW